MMAVDLFLRQAEIDDLCHPLTQPAAQVRFLRASGLNVTVKPNGRPAVVRSHAEAVLSGRTLAAPAESSEQVEKPEAPATPRPNVEGFMKVIQGGKKNGPQKKVQPA
jgi:hypothetical protein